MGEVVLSVRGITKQYQSGDAATIRALDSISLDISAGELVAIVGPSGSGKSTFLMLAGLLECPTDGEIFVAGERASFPTANLDRWRSFRRKNIGFVFQKANLIPFLTAVENVALALEIDGISSRLAKSYAIELLRALDLDHRSHNHPSSLSGGEQQRVAVARSLANNPSLILADEPTAALDGIRGMQVLQLFRRIAQARSTGVVVVTHDSRTLDLFDRVVEFREGRASVQMPKS